MKKAFIIRILILAFAGYLIYSGTRSILSIGRLVLNKYKIAQNGIVTEGEFIKYFDRGYYRGKHGVTRYKFYLIDYKNTQMDDLLRHHLGEDRYIEHQQISLKVKEILNESEPEGDWVWGEGFGRYASGKLSPGDKMKVTYLPDNPRRNLAGDCRNSSIINLFGMEWIRLLLWFAMAIIGIILGLVLFQGFYWNKKNIEQ